MDDESLERALEFEGQMAAWFTVMLRDFPNSPHRDFYVESARRHVRAGQRYWREYSRRIRSLS